jgi:hypothetical protein
LFLFLYWIANFQFFFPIFLLLLLLHAVSLAGGSGDNARAAKLSYPTVTIKAGSSSNTMSHVHPGTVTSGVELKANDAAVPGADPKGHTGVRERERERFFFFFFFFKTKSVL